MRARDYQREAIKKTVARWDSGIRSLLFICPTGGGKSFVFSHLAKHITKQGGRTLILTDRKTLTDQAAGNVTRLGLTVGFEQAKRRTGADLPDVVCATIQSISRPDRLRQFKRNAFDLVVVDEADLGVAPSYLSVLKHFRKAKVFGCTATPDRADKQTLGDVFEEVVSAVEMIDLIKRGYLSRLRRHLVRIESVSLEKVQTKNGDFSDKALERILTQEKPLHEVVKPTQEMAERRPSIVFAATVAHAEALAGVFNRYRKGSARAIHGGMDDAERGAIADAFRRGDFQFLCNCALLLRGVDLPFVSCVAMARPTKSRALYAQALGRGTRIAEGKPDLLVLDFTDNSERHDLISPIDVLAPSVDEVIKERAREIMDEGEADPLGALEEGERQLAADPVLRETVRAKVEYLTREAPSANKGINWDAEPLGEAPDAVMSQKWHVSVTAVRLARVYRGIPAYKGDTPMRGIDWDAQPLGKIPDGKLAELLGVRQGTVQAARQRRGIAVFSTRKKPSVDWVAIGLGTRPDGEIANELGVPKNLVFKERKDRGIPRYCKPSFAIDWDAQPLGLMKDADLARLLGVSLTTVYLARTRRNIIAFAKSSLFNSAIHHGHADER